MSTRMHRDPTICRLPVLSAWSPVEGRARAPDPGRPGDDGAEGPPGETACIARDGCTFRLVGAYGQVIATLIADQTEETRARAVERLRKEAEARGLHVAPPPPRV
jgi:hypothetical protein